jgi:hypothetical protein
MMRRMWRDFEGGGLLRSTLLWMLRVLAVLAVLVGVYAGIVFAVELFRRGTLFLVLAGILVLILYALALYAIVRTIWLRANDLAGLELETFPAFGLVALLVRLSGEVGAILLLFVGVAGALLVWGGGRGMGDFLGPLVEPFGPFALNSPLGVILVGVSLIVLFAVRAVLALLMAYFIAEAIALLRGLFMNARAIRASLAPPEPPADEGAISV